MNKFPMLNNLKAFYSLIAVVILIIGGLMSFAMADSMGTSEYNSRTNSSQTQPNVLVGIVVFVTAVSVASGFLLASELISLALRAEDHLEKIKNNLSRGIPNTIPTMSSDPKGGSSDSFDSKLRNSLDKSKNPVSAVDAFLANSGKSSPDVSSKSFPNPDSYRPQMGDLSIIFPVKAYQMNVFKHPSVQSDVLLVLTSAKSVTAFKCDSKGLFVYVEINHNNELIYGWVKARELNIDSEKLNDLPQVNT